MTTMRRVKVEWNGLGGLPGLSTFYYGVASPNVSDLVTFFTTLRPLFPTSLTWNIPQSGDELDDATGALTGGWLGSGGGSVTANGGNLPYAAGVGARVQWNTGIIVGRRRVRGTTFLAPMLGSKFDSSGTIDSAALTTLQVACSTLAASGVAKGIWHRPVNGTGGQYCAINDAIVPDRVTSLRSRRT